MEVSLVNPPDFKMNLGSLNFLENFTLIILAIKLKHPSKTDATFHTLSSLLITS